MNYTVPRELMMRWITCTCWRNGIQYICFRPEFLVPQNFNGTSKYPCMEAQEGEDSKAERSLSPPGCSALSVTCLNPTLPEKTSKYKRNEKMNMKEIVSWVVLRIPFLGDWIASVAMTVLFKAFFDSWREY